MNYNIDYNNNINNSDNSDNKNIIDINNNNYIIKTEMNKSLSKEFGIDKEDDSENINYDIPNKHGLDNCNVIIPNYYFNLLSFDQFDYFTIIKDDIRNFRKLNNYQLEYIKKLDHDKKDIIITLLNDCISLIS
jgi:hypothetical protein